LPAAESPLEWYLSGMTSPASPPASPAPTGEAIRKALRAVKDPELNLNIIDIGLVYDVESSADGDVRVEMTLTSPGCPAGAEIIEDVKRVVGDLEGVRSVEVELVWEPYWTPEKMDPRVRAFLGF
jgi:metal-sulfur cluster biosynthetic enzyme